MREKALAVAGEIAVATAEKVSGACGSAAPTARGWRWRVEVDDGDVGAHGVVGR